MSDNEILGKTVMIPDTQKKNEQRKSKRQLIREKGELLEELRESEKEKVEISEEKLKLISALKEISQTEENLIDPKDLQVLLEELDLYAHTKKQHELSYLTAENLTFLFGRAVPVILMFAALLIISMFSTSSDWDKLIGLVGAVILGVLVITYLITGSSKGVPHIFKVFHK